MTRQYQEPDPNCFGTISLSRLRNGYPSPEMLFPKNLPQLSENKINASYTSVAAYLGVQHDLLLEDFMYPLRQALEAYKKYPQTRTFDGARVCRNVRLKKLDADPRRRSAIYALDLEDMQEERKTSNIQNRKKPSDAQDKEKPSFGSLLLFTRSDFQKDVFFGKVTSDWEKTERLEIEIEPGYGVERNSFTMMEAKGFYYKYASILKVLGSFDESNFPFKEFIVYGIKDDRYPSYIRQDTQYNVFGSSVNVASDRPWKLREDLEMDDSQRTALAYALTRKIAVLQGPPGTGKTYFGVRMVKVLLDNINVWNPSGRTPLLVVCQSNAALDHFLKGLSKYTTNIVRVGEQGSKDLGRYFLGYLADKYKKNAPGVPMSAVRETVLQNAHVVGLTTTGASTRRDILEMLQSPIVVVEEAAEVLEADVLASMTKYCRHLILLGDHKQLRPIVTTHHLATDYNLDRSLFERLIVSEVVRSKCLTTQYRMRPEISCLLKPHIYKHLDDAPSTLKRSRIEGMQKSVFFLHHEKYESTSSGKTGFFNDHEAKMLTRLANYLVCVGYSPSRITIISMYLEQRNKLAKEREKYPNLKRTDIASVDSFQGKENDIILLSLVRSNKGGNIGFLKEENRACVALSRAKEGMFIMGNSKCLANPQRHDGRTATVWTHVVRRLVENNAIGPELPLRCDVHNASFKVSKIEDWNEKFCKACSGERMQEEPKETPEVELLRFERQRQDVHRSLLEPSQEDQEQEIIFSSQLYDMLFLIFIATTLLLIFVVGLLIGKNNFFMTKT